MLFMAELTDKEQTLTEEEFLNFEQLFSQKIPESFKFHYLKNNGGCPDEKDVENGKWGLHVHGFNSIKYGKLTIEELITDIEAIIPEDNTFGTWEQRFSFIPFAYDAGGHTIFISLKDNDYDSVYIYDSDGRNIYMIAPSFKIFLSRLYK